MVVYVTKQFHSNCEKLIMKMEEKQIVQVEVFSQLHQLSRTDFINFKLILHLNQFPEIKIPFKVFNQEKVQALNVFLYYIISIQKNFKVFPQDLFGDKYRIVCTKQLSNYYIKNKFIIEQYEFSYLAAKALSMRLQQCAHIIYYLIYGRFASHPYINTLCGKKDYDFKTKIFKKGKETFENLKLLKKRTVNHEKNPNQFQIQTFCKDLKAALKSQDTHMIWKKQNFKNKPDDEKTNVELMHGQSQNATERKQLNRGHSYNSFIPQRISQGENSYIFQTLPFQKKSFQTCTDWNRKGLMRKQKFNEFFDINDLKIKTKLKKSPSLYTQQNKENYSRSGNIGNDYQQLGKINYQSFKSISNGLKAKNVELDKIRGQCATRNHKSNVQNQNQLFVRLNPGFKEFSKEASTLCNKRNKRQNDTEQSLGLRRNLTTFEGSNLRQMSLSKKFSESNPRNFEYVFQEETTDNQNIYAINLLRNEQITKSKENQEVKRFDYFSQNTTGFKNMNCKHKLQKYKSDYRRFMKTQLLDRIKQAT